MVPPQATSVPGVKAARKVRTGPVAHGRGPRGPEALTKSYGFWASSSPAEQYVPDSPPHGAIPQVRPDSLANGGDRFRHAHRLVRRGATSVAWGKGLPGRRIMAQNSPQDGHGEHRNSRLRVRRGGRRCDGSQVNR